MTHKTTISYSLYVITDQGLARNQALAEIIQSAIKGGATIVQYREKNASTRIMIKEGRILRGITKKAHIPLIINDRIDLALAIDADGVHIGQDDMPASYARKILGKKKILGVSVKTVKQARDAIRNRADYVGVGDIFGTTSKTDAGKPIGLARVKEITNAVSIPIVGIGGITKENAASVIASGADGIAVISAVIGKPNPEQEARELRNIIKITKERRKHGKNN